MHRLLRLHLVARPLGVALALVVAAACSPQPTPRTAAGAAAEPAADRAKVAEGEGTPAPPADSADAETGPGTAGRSALEPPDGVWLTDESGKEYFLYELKKEGRFKRLGDNMIQIQYGLLLEVAKEDEDTFWIKIYRGSGDSRLPSATAPSVARAQEPEPAPPTAAAESVEAPTTAAVGDRLTFEPFDRGLPRRGQWRNGFAIGDLDGDGHLDIVHGPPRKDMRGEPRIFLGDGEGKWRGWAPAFSPPRLDYGDVALADFNGDGRLDIAFAVHLLGVVVMVATGDGDFVTWSKGIEYALPEAHQGRANFSSRRILAVDWNGDGRMDLVAMGEGPGMARDSGGTPGFSVGAGGPMVFLNRGDGSWEPRSHAGGNRPFGDDLAVGDVDGDGRLDIVTASMVVGRSDILYLGQADGSFAPVELPGVRPQSIVRAVAIADFDADGRADVALGYAQHEAEAWSSGVDVLLSRPGGEWEVRPAAQQEGATGPWSLAAGDLDADGRLDLVAATETGELWVLLGDGAGDFSRDRGAGLTPPGNYCTGFRVALADLDGEPGDELVAGFAGEAGSEQVFIGEKRCPTGGVLDAWRVAKK